MAQSHSDVVVIGAGAFGVWTALALIERGASVTLVDAHGPGNPLGSSGGESRNIRSAYGDRAIYTRWSMRAWDLWQTREAEFGVRCLYPSGSLRVLESAEVAVQRAVFDALGQQYELITSDEARARWPQLGYRDAQHILYEPCSGTLTARAAMNAVAERFRAKGGRLVQARAVLPTAPTERLERLTIGDESVAAGTFVFACGPWLPRLFPELLRRYIKTPRRELFFLGPAPGDRRFDWDRCPNLADPLGWTSANIGGGVKIAPILRHVPMDPEHGDRNPTPALLDQVRAYVAARLPDLAGQPVVATYVSQLENTDNEHFIIDRHPELSDVVIAGGGSGHAFKMGPVIGEQVAGLVLGDPPDPALQALFGLAAHGPVGADQGG